MNLSLHQRLMNEGLRFIDVVPEDRIDYGTCFSCLSADYGINIVAVIDADLAPEIRLADWIESKDPRVLYANTPQNT